jgi:hypothetical protein
MGKDSSSLSSLVEGMNDGRRAIEVRLTRGVSMTVGLMDFERCLW